MTVRSDIAEGRRETEESVNESERIIVVNELKMNESLERIKISITIRQKEVFSQRASEENTSISAMTHLNVSDWSLHS